MGNFEFETMEDGVISIGEEDDKLWQQAMDEMIEHERRQAKLFRTNFNNYIKNRADGQPAKAMREFLDGNIHNIHVGYVKVNEYDDNGAYARLTGWYNKKLYRVDVEDTKQLPELEGLTFTEESDDEYSCRKPIRYLCWQRCEWVDDFRGYLLFPMKDGKYWCTYFTM